MNDNPFSQDINKDQEEINNFMNQDKKNLSNNHKKAKMDLLKAREAELLRRQQQIKETKSETFHLPNWPSKYPLIYVDLENDIPPAAHSTINNSLYGLINIIIYSFLNTITVLSITGISQYPKLNNFIFATIQGIATVYYTINYSYQKIYDSCKKHDVPFTWTIIQFSLIGWCIYRTIGFPSSGSVGIALFLDLLAKDSKTFSRFLALINTGLSCSATYFQFKVLMEAQKYQKISGRDDEKVLNQNS